MSLRLGFTDNEAPVYRLEDTDKDGRPNEGATPQAIIEYRDPTADEEIGFNREYFSAVQSADKDAGAAVAEVLYKFGSLVATGARELVTPAGLGPLEALRKFGARHLMGVAQRAFLTPRSRIDLGKPASSPVSGSAASSAGSSEAPATS